MDLEKSVQANGQVLPLAGGLTRPFDRQRRLVREGENPEEKGSSTGRLNGALLLALGLHSPIFQGWVLAEAVGLFADPTRPRRPSSQDSRIGLDDRSLQLTSSNWSTSRPSFCFCAFVSREPPVGWTVRQLLGRTPSVTQTCLRKLL